LGDWLSRLGGHPSPKRELESLGGCLHVPLRHETLVCLGESLSRLGQSSSPKRVIEVWLVGCETRRLGEVRSSGRVRVSPKREGARLSEIS